MSALVKRLWNTSSILFALAAILMMIFLFVFNQTTFFSGMKIDEATSTLSRPN